MIVLPRIVAYIVFTVLGVAYQLPSGVPAAGGRLGIDGENFQDMAAQLNDTQQQILAVQGLKEMAIEEALKQEAAMQVPSKKGYVLPGPHWLKLDDHVMGTSDINPRLLQEMREAESKAPLRTRQVLEGTGDRGGLLTELWGN